MDDKTVSKVLLDVQKEYAKSNKIKDKIIMLLIVLMFAESSVKNKHRKLLIKIGNIM